MRAGFVDGAGDFSAHFASEGDAAAASVGFEQGVVGALVFGRDACGVAAVSAQDGPAPFVAATGSAGLAVEFCFHVEWTP